MTGRMVRVRLLGSAKDNELRLDRLSSFFEEHTRGERKPIPITVRPDLESTDNGVFMLPGGDEGEWARNSHGPTYTATEAGDAAVGSATWQYTSIWRDKILR